MMQGYFGVLSSKGNINCVPFFTGIPCNIYHFIAKRKCSQFHDIMGIQVFFIGRAGNGKTIF